MPLYTPWPNGDVLKPTGVQRKALYYHGFHDMPDSDCRACAWEQHI